MRSSNFSNKTWNYWFGFMALQRERHTLLTLQHNEADLRRHFSETAQPITAEHDNNGGEGFAKKWYTYQGRTIE